MMDEMRREKEQRTRQLERVYRAQAAAVPPQPTCRDCLHWGTPWSTSMGECAFLAARVGRPVEVPGEDIVCMNAALEDSRWARVLNFRCAKCGAVFHTGFGEEKTVDPFDRRRCPECFSHQSLREVPAGVRYVGFWVRTGVDGKVPLDADDGNVERPCLKI